MPILLMILQIAVITGAIAPQNAQNVQELLPNAPVERELSVSEVHYYQIKLSSGQHCRVYVEQRGIDVGATIYGTDSQLIGKARSAVEQNFDKATVVAETTGDYRIEVSPLSKRTARGRYMIIIEDLREATDRDRSHNIAHKIYMEAEKIRESNTAEAFRKAILKYEEALPHWRAAGDQRGEATILDRLAVVSSILNDEKTAIGYSMKALELRRAMKDRRGEAGTLNNLGLIYSRLGELQNALQCYRRAIPILQEIGNRAGHGRALNNLGLLYKNLGENQKALESFQESLLIRRSLESGYEEGIVLNNLGVVHRLLGDEQKALDCFNQALAIMQKLDRPLGQLKALNNIGRAVASMGDYQKALEYYNKGLALAETLGDRSEQASTFDALGDLYNKMGDNNKALEFFNKALGIWRQVGRHQGEADTLLYIARVERDIGRLDEAEAHAKNAIALFEFLRFKVIDQELKATFLDSKRDHYQFHTELLMQLHKKRPEAGFDALALEASEQARARNLLESLVEANADIRQGVAPELLERERRLQQLINVKDQERVKLLSGKHTEEQAATAKKELDELIKQYQQLQSQIRSTSPRYAALTQPTPLKLKDIQQLLDRETLLLEYSLGEDRSYLWAVTIDSIRCFELPKRIEIEKVARSVYDLLLVSHKTISRRSAQLAAAKLGRIALGPVAGLLGKKRLLIVSDGALQYIPFGALTLPDSRLPLIVDHEIVSLPSASTLGVLRKEMAGRKRAERAIAVLADPVLQIDDSRVKQASKSQSLASEQVASSDLERSVGEAGFKFERLFYTRQEAEAIALQAGSEKIFKALDFDASRKTFFDPRLEEYRIIHFATHGVLNSTHPELSGVVLSLVDENGKLQDGFVRAHDIYNLRLNAELVVLSACRTALGKDVKGEGLVGLTRGFMYAGAERVVASLWDVRDEATAELMKRFYRGMLKQGLSPAAALRSAQVSMWKEKRWQAPYYWAGFVLQGEWK
jgi:CHAT domain-containing protein/Tfp pilus assembly protein PilF